MSPPSISAKRNICSASATGNSSSASIAISPASTGKSALPLKGDAASASISPERTLAETRGNTVLMVIVGSTLGDGADLRGGLLARGHRHVDLLDHVMELRIEAVARLFQIDGNFADDASRIGREQKDAVAHQHRFLDIVRHQDHAFDRQLAFAPELEEIGAQRLRRQDVERRERLVHEQDIGMDDERAGKADALTHAAGQFTRIGRFVAVQADQIDSRQGTLADFRLGQAERFEAELHVFQHRQPGKQREGLEDHGDAGRGTVHRLPEIGDGSRPTAAPGPRSSAAMSTYPIRCGPRGRRSGPAPRSVRRCRAPDARRHRRAEKSGAANECREERRSYDPLHSRNLRSA